MLSARSLVLSVRSYCLCVRIVCASARIVCAFARVVRAFARIVCAFARIVCAFAYNDSFSLSQAARAGSILADDSQPAQNLNSAGSEENAAKILTYEEAFQQIKDATGVSDTAEVVERSVNDGRILTVLNN